MTNKNKIAKAYGHLRGSHLLDSGRHNKSTAFTLDEREALGLRGLLLYNVSGQDTHKKRALGNLRRKAYDIEKYICLLYTSPSPRDLSTSRMPSSA